MKKILRVLILCICVITVLLLCLLRYTRHSMADMMSQIDETTYDSHYVMICDDTSDLWQSVFHAAKKAAEDSGAALEWIGKDLPAEYDMKDYLRIAAANKADGIILHIGTGDKVTGLIDEASHSGVPVITVLNDDPDSSRVSYIGINSYQMGELYGKSILQNLKKGNNTIMVLMNAAVQDVTSSILYSQMVQVVEKGRDDDQNVVFSVHEIDASTSFDAEEDIRDIFLKPEDLPNILICPDLMLTECVSQALVDYNEVGNVTVLGYYASEKVKDSVRKGLIEATLLLDTQEIGQLCIEALNEYRQLGRVNSYYNVGIQLITIRTLPREDYQDQEDSA